MKLSKHAKRLLTAALAILLLMSITSCEQPQSAPESPSVPPISETPDPLPIIATPTSPHTPQETPHPESSSPTSLEPPLVPKAERRYMYTPYLVKLEPYTGGLYTDGNNTYFIELNRTVRISPSSGYAFVLEARDIPKPQINPELYYSDEFAAIIEIASKKVSELMGYEMDLYASKFEYWDAIIHKDDDTYYLHIDITGGGGSGEAYYHTDKSFFLKISVNGDVFDYGKIRAAHIVWHDGYFYYVELADGLLWTPGIGRVIRMDMDGTNKKTIVSEPVYGPFTITNDRLYYSNLADGKAYSVGLDGKDKTPVGSRFAPDNHRVSLRFYDDMIISDYWYNAGYGFGIFVYPINDYTGPAIMDANGNNLLTFPAELCGDNAYEVINWGSDNSESDSYLFLKSNYDGSYWVYKKTSNSAFGEDPYFTLYEHGRQEWADRAD